MVSKNQPQKKGFIKTVLVFFLLLFITGMALTVGVFLYVAKDLPSPETIISRKVSESTKIYDRTGNIVLYDIHGEEKRTIIAWENISENIKKTIESHGGKANMYKADVSNEGEVKGLFTYLSQEFSFLKDLILMCLILIPFLAFLKFRIPLMKF